MDIYSHFYFQRTSDGQFLNEEPLYLELVEKINNAPTVKIKSDIIFNFWGTNRGNMRFDLEVLINDIIEEARLLKDYYALGWCYFVLGWIKSDYDKYNESLDLFALAQEKFARSGNKAAQIRAINGEATAYMRSGYFDQALEKYLIGLELAETIKDSFLINLFAGNIGILLVEINQHEEALKYFIKAQSMGLTPSPTMALQICYIGKAYRCLGKFTLAEQKILESLSLSEKGNNRYAKANCILEMGYIRLSQNKTSEAQRYFRKCVEYGNGIGFPRTKAIALLQLGIIEKINYNFNVSLDLLFKSLSIFRKINARSFEVQALSAISEVYDKLGDYASAYITLKECKELDSEVFGEETINKIGILKVKQMRREDLIYKDLYNRIKTISHIGQMITATFDLQEIGNKVYTHINQLMDAESLAIGLYTEDEKSVIYKIYIKEGKFLPEFTVPVRGTDSVEGQCISNCEGLLYKGSAIEKLNMAGGRKRPSQQPEEQIKSLICCPLVVRDKTLGLISIQSDKENAYLPYHLDMLKALAAYIAIALENERLFSHIKKLATIDSLTEIPNRRSIFQKAEKEFARYKRYGDPLSVIMIDIDQFKLVNDSYGHAAGDIVLKRVAETFLEVTRAADMIGRIGGEEFLMILPNTTLKEAASLGKRLCRAVSAKEYMLLGKKKVKITVSVGVAELSPADKDISLAISRADHASYQAKKEGGNKVRKTD